MKPPTKEEFEKIRAKLIGKPYTWLTTPNKIIDVFPYTGKFDEMFDCVIRFGCPSTRRGYMDCAFNSSKYENF